MLILSKKTKKCFCFLLLTLKDNFPTTLSPGAIALNQREVSPKGDGKYIFWVSETSAISKDEKVLSELFEIPKEIVIKLNELLKK